ncbi:MAG: histidine kinase dimerization/phospho-acceptor domain-containing protein [Terricaulis sp.]
MKSDFLANISHELRTPLDAVIGYAELIEEELADLGLATATEDLNRIRAAGRHLLTLITEILDLSKIEAGKMEITPSSFGIEEMLTMVVAPSGRWRVRTTMRSRSISSLGWATPIPMNCACARA